MITTTINTAQRNMATNHLNRIFSIFLTALLFSCSLGFNDPKSLKADASIGLDNINVIDINFEIVEKERYNLENYRISTGDILSIVVFGQNDFFPITYSGINNPYTSKLVDEKGFIFFPYAGDIKVSGSTVAEVRKKVTDLLSKNFIDPQVDVSITEFNETRNVYVLGEVVRPQTIKIGLVPITLSSAISQSNGLSPATSNASKIFVIRSTEKGGVVYRTNFNNSANLLISGQFNLLPGDIVFVGPANIARWNRYISQLFPFASFLNQVDAITTD